jgi:hypothetical protein
VKPTKNRKYKSMANTITHNGTEYDINARKSGIYPQQLHSIIDQLDICLTKWRRVLVLRVELHQNHYTDDSRMISRFRKNLARKLDRNYGITELGYSWVREMEKSKQQHYHLALYLDGDIIQHPRKLNLIIAETWERVRAGNTVGHPSNCFHYVADENSKAKAVYRISYMAKARGKGYRPPQAKDYGNSRLIASRKPVLTINDNSAGAAQ